MKKLMPKRQLMFSYDTFWGVDVTPEIGDILKEVPIAPALQFVAQMLNKLLKRTKFDTWFHQQEVLHWKDLMDGNTNLIVTNEVKVNPTFKGNEFVITDRICYLKLIQELLKATNTRGNELVAEDHTALFKSLMLINGTYTGTQEELFNWDIKGDEEEYLKIILPTHISELGISRPRSFWVQTIKSYYFFNFCQSDKEYSKYLKIFLDHYRFTAFQAYIAAVSMPYLKMSIGQTPVSTIQIDPEAKDVLQVFTQLSINAKAIVNEDFKTLREYPLYQSDTQTFTVLFENFFLDKLYNGMLFDFTNIVKTGGVGKMDFRKLKIDLGNKFSEHVMFYRTMERCFGNFGQIRKSGQELRLTLKKGEPDYYIRDGRKVFIFEFKDILMAAQAKTSDSLDIIKAEISEKLEVSVKDSLKPQSKAIRQLLNSIQRLLFGEYAITNTDKGTGKDPMIYPIIVHNDAAFEAEGVNYILRTKMNEMIVNADIPQHLIKNLLVVNIDTLVAFQDHFANNHVKLANCINEYNTYIGSHGALNRMMAFDEFIKYYLASKKVNIAKSPMIFQDILNEVVNYQS